MRRLYILLIVAGVVLFLAVSAILARVFSADGAEHSAIVALIEAEARGDGAAMAGRLTGCSATPACRASTAADAAKLHRSGAVVILQLQSSTGFSLAGTLGTARVAWRAGGSLPIVQCVRVRRVGDAISGLQVQLLKLSSRIATDGDCPSRF